MGRLPSPRRFRIQTAALALALLGPLTGLNAQPAAARGQFKVGALQRSDELPNGRFRKQLEKLPAATRERAMQRLRSFQFPADDVSAMHTDASGGVCYACEFTLPEVAEVPAESIEAPVVAEAALPNSQIPAHLIFHSRPGAPNVIYLNFVGETVTGTEWNTTLGRTEIPAVPFSSDSDFTTFNDSEQAVIKRVWQRISEDYSLFDVDVTTERPASFTDRTAMALITRSTDANGEVNPNDASGGVAYVNVFASSIFSICRPAWIYVNRLNYNDSYIAEAASHEIGHNLGLSHDGTTSSGYYGGHGGGDISWGPLMGTGYNRNVSQWSKGDYYQANNTQDDLTVIAGKLSYRSDDHAASRTGATPLVVTGGTQIVATTPENDPANTDTTNKGVLERAADVDVFSFVTGDGPVQLDIKPWISPVGTRGGNLDLQVELYDDAGTLLLTNNDADRTTAVIATTLTGGRYYLFVKNSAAGAPLASSPTGYTAYGSLGQYFISGSITENTGFIETPLATLQTTDLNQPGQTGVRFSVTYKNSVPIDVATIGAGDLRITGPNGYEQLAQLVSLDMASNGTPRTATYEVTPTAGGSWTPAHNGIYQISMESDQVRDTAGTAVAAGPLGQFSVAVTQEFYRTNMDSNPGWTMQSSWQYGTPAYPSSGPTSGFTGSKILGFNLSGSYSNNLSLSYATTPVINTSGSSSLTLHFKRWLRNRSGDQVVIEASTNGVSWITVWSESNQVADGGWQSVEYPLPSTLVGSPTLRLRWGLASNSSQNDIGWNLDDVVLTGTLSLDSDPPHAVLTVANLTSATTQGHPCDVTYTDSIAVKRGSLGSSDLLVSGPNGYSKSATFVSANLSTDGSPITGSYLIPAPDGIAWTSADNGNYTITLRQGEVEDTAGNTSPSTSLGSFSVNIIPASPGSMAVTGANNLAASGVVGGPFTPGTVVYTVTNPGGSAIDWSAAKTTSWLDLSPAGGSLAPGASALVTVTIHASANQLPAASYSDTVEFTNTTNGGGNTIRSVSLNVIRPGELVVESPATLAATGTVGGPFSPGASVYTLRNTGGTAIDWAATYSSNWVDLNPTGGSLAPGASTTVTVALNSQANSLVAGTYDATLNFAFTADGVAPADGGNSASTGGIVTREMVLTVLENLRVLGQGFSGTGVFEVVVQGSPGAQVALEGSTDFNRWENVNSGVIGEDGTLTLGDPESPGFPTRFYRASVSPP